MATKSTKSADKMDSTNPNSKPNVKTPLAPEITRSPSFSFLGRKKFRILALDGGGVRSLIQARILRRIVQLYPHFLSEIDLITGTSAGSIVGMALANNIHPDKLSDWFEQEIPKIFYETYTKEVTSLANMISAEFETSELKRVLQEQLGDKKLDDIPYRVLIPAFNLQPQVMNDKLSMPLSPPPALSKFEIKKEEIKEESSKKEEIKKEQIPKKEEVKKEEKEVSKKEEEIPKEGENKKEEKKEEEIPKKEKISKKEEEIPKKEEIKKEETPKKEEISKKEEIPKKEELSKKEEIPKKEELSQAKGNEKKTNTKEEHQSPKIVPDDHRLRYSQQGFEFANRWKPEFLHNFPSSLNGATLAVDAVLRSTAAPTYFPIYQGYVDGGVFANNPSLAALTTSIHHGIALEDICILSLGTGFNPTSLGPSQYSAGNWGMFEWAPYLIGMLLDANTEAITYQTQILLNERYHRLNPLLPRDIGLGDASAVPELKEIGDDVDLSNTKRWLEDVWEINNSSPELHEEPTQPNYCLLQ